MLPQTITKNDKKANILIITFSIIVFVAVTALSRITVNVNLGFNKHLFATVNAFINSIVAVLLIAALVAIKQKKYQLHKQLMLTAMVLSVLFLVSYICHHLFTGDTKYGGIGTARTVYFVILITHIFLAAIIMPFVLYTAYRALVGEYSRHKKLAKITWPIWFYVAVTGPIVYWLISPYYT